MASRDSQRYMKNVNKLFGQGETKSKVKPSTPRKRAPDSVCSSAKAGRLPASKDRSSKTSPPIVKRHIAWRDYEAVFNAMDKQKYPFPALGHERFFDMFTTLFQFYCHSGIALAPQERQGVGAVAAQQVKWVSSFGIDPAYYGRLMASDLYERLLLPVFGAAYGTFDRAVLDSVSVQGKPIRTSFLCNTALLRLVKWMDGRLTGLSAAVLPAASADDVDASAVREGSESQVASDAKDDADLAPVTPQATKKPAASSKRGPIRQHDVSMQVKQNARRYNEQLQAKGIVVPDPIWCECCRFSYRVLVTFGDSNDRVNWREYYQATSLPLVYVNAQFLLAWPLTPADFERDFCLSTRLTGKAASPLHKTIAIYKMGFYQRIYSLHLWIYFIVMWLWTLQRTVHERSSLFSSNSDNAPYSAVAVTAFPVHLVVEKKLQRLIETVPSLPLAKLRQTRKLFVQYI